MPTENYTKAEIDEMLEAFVKKDGSTPITGEQTFEAGLKTDAINSDADLTLEAGDAININAENVNVSPEAQLVTPAKIIMQTIDPLFKLTINAEGMTGKRVQTFPDASGELDLSNQ